jgi:phosphoglycolate phosphatase-like HAD superfamily hydrolase
MPGAGSQTSVELAGPVVQELDAESAGWLRRLSAGDGARLQEAEGELHARLLRIALAEVRRRSASTPATGPELVDVAHQAADDAMLAVLAKLASFHLVRARSGARRLLRRRGGAAVAAQAAGVLIPAHRDGAVRGVPVGYDPGARLRARLHRDEPAGGQAQRLVGLYEPSAAVPGCRPGLRDLTGLGYELAVFSNGSHDMIGNCLANSSLGEFFGQRISVDEARAFKPRQPLPRRLRRRARLATAAAAESRRGPGPGTSGLASAVAAEPAALLKLTVPRHPARELITRGRRSGSGG